MAGLFFFSVMGNYLSHATMEDNKGSSVRPAHFEGLATEPHLKGPPKKARLLSYHPRVIHSERFMNGVVIVLHGKLISTKFTHVRVKRLVEKHGGRVETHSSKLDRCTHLVTTQREVDKSYQHPKIQIANSKKRPIVSVNWLIVCSQRNCLVPVDEFLLKPTVRDVPKTVDLTVDLAPQDAAVEVPESASAALANAENIQGLIVMDSIRYGIQASTMWPDNSNKVRALGLQTIVTVKKSTMEYQLLENYFNFSTAAYAPPLYPDPMTGYTGYTPLKKTQIKVRNIYRIERLDEATRYTNWKEKNKSKYRPRLLWHGSPKKNFHGILRDGLRGDVGERGIYASELAGYSISYSQKCHTSYNRLGMELMLLCEAGITRANSNTSKYRDAVCIHPDLEGVDMLDIGMGDLYPNGMSIQFEHCMGRKEQMRMRYLFQFEVCAS